MPTATGDVRVTDVTLDDEDDAITVRLPGTEARHTALEVHGDGSMEIWTDGGRKTVCILRIEV